ncbi:MAG: hypothetical protein V4449_03115 [Patescibacteria group bacterium]
MNKKLVIILSLLLIFTPLATFAAVEQNPANLLSGGGGGLVPECEGPFCRACDLLELANNVINFGVAFSVIVATLMFAYAGIMYVSAASSEGQIKKAHGVFTNVFVGLLLVLLSWLLVNILFSVLTGKGLSEWTKISCIANPVSAGFADVPVIPQGETLEEWLKKAGTYVASGGQCSIIKSGPCSPENLAGYFGAPNATNMSIICRVESSGNPQAGGDIGWYTKKPFSYGLFQINLTAHQVSCPDGRVLNCPKAFGSPANPAETRTMIINGRPTKISAGAGWGKPIVNQTLYNQCVTAATDVSCNLHTAKNTFEKGDSLQYGHYQAWKTDVIKCNLN